MILYESGNQYSIGYVVQGVLTGRQVAEDGVATAQDGEVLSNAQQKENRYF